MQVNSASNNVSVARTAAPRAAAKAQAAPMAQDSFTSKARAQAQPEAPKKKHHFPWIESIGTGVCTAVGAGFGAFAVGMADRAVSLGETLSSMGTGALVVGGIGALVFFGIGGIIRAYRN